MGLNINGKVIIYKNTYGYSTAISNKKQDGTYDKMYLSLQLPKGVELQDRTMIDITEGFLSFYSTKEGLPKIKVVVMNYFIINSQKKQEEQESLSDSELPF